MTEKRLCVDCIHCFQEMGTDGNFGNEVYCNSSGKKKQIGDLRFEGAWDAIVADGCKSYEEDVSK